MTAPWATSTVGEQFDVRLGKMLDAAKNVGIPKPYIGNRAVQWGRIDPSAGGIVPMTRSDLQRYRLREGDLLVCEGGDVGRGAIWRNELPECYYQKALHRLRTKSGYDARLMLALLQYWSSIGAFSDFVTQTSIAHLPREKFIVMPLPLPSEAEQRWMGDAIQDTDDLIATLERLIAKKQAIKQGMMQQLLTGRTRLPGFSDSWADVVLGDVAQFGKGVGLPKSALTASGSTPCIHYGELFTFYGPEIFQAASRTNPTGRMVVSEDLDVLMPTSDVTPRGLAKASAIHGSGVVLGGDVLIIRPDKARAYGPFLAHAIRRDAGQVLQLVRGSTVYHLYAADMRNFTLSIPSVEEQRAITDVLLDTEHEIDALGRRLGKARDIKTGMMQQLLTGRVRLPLDVLS